jgi:DNA-binding transcriptional LysR family regulator
VELRQLEHFIAVAEERSFTRAAGRVHLVQSALSVSIRALERDLGTRVFERSTHHVSLTDAGEALLPEARRTLAAAEQARDAVSAVQGIVRGTLRIGIMQSLTLVDVASLLARFHDLHPRVEIQTRPAPGGSVALAEDVRRGRLDCAFVSLPGGIPSGLSITPLATEPFFLFAARGRLPSGGKDLTLRDLEGAGFVDFPPGWGTRVAIDQAFAAAGFERSVEVEVADVSTYVELVRAGLGLGFLPRSMFASSAMYLDSCAISSIPLWNVGLAVSVGTPPTAAATAFLALVHGGDEPVIQADRSAVQTRARPASEKA